MARERKPWLAVLFSFAAPGLGHLYAGRPRRALSWAAAALLSAPLVVKAGLDGARGGIGLVLLLAVPLLLLVLILVTAWRTAKAMTGEFTPAWYNHWFIYVGYCVVVGSLAEEGISLWLRNRYKAFRNPSEAMAPSLLAGDFFYMRFKRDAALPAVGAMVVFASAEEPGLQVIKRVVGLPGDTLSMQGGSLSRNGSVVAEPFTQHDSSGEPPSQESRKQMREAQRPYYIGPDTTGYAPDLGNWGPLIVPRDSVFLLGDNRERSYDSRHFGSIARHRILGSPSLIYYSYDPFGWKPLPAFTAIRGERIGMSLDR